MRRLTVGESASGLVGDLPLLLLLETRRMWPGSGLDFPHEPRTDDVCDRCEVVDVVVELEFSVENDGREVFDTGVGRWYRCGLSARTLGLANGPSIGVGESSVS